MTVRLVAFCEAAADFQITSELVDRVLREVGPDWVADVMDAEPEGDRDREQRGWTEAPLALLRTRGQLTGLAAFLVEIATHLVPLLGPLR
jgi:hypothetical protein